jgi:translation initiation factor 3 subunit L
MPQQFIVHFYQAVQENNLAEISVSYESGWNRLTEKYYAKTEWPEAELIAPLVNDGTYSHLVLSLCDSCHCFA